MLKYLFFICIVFSFSLLYAQKGYIPMVVGFYNLENFYDTIDDPQVDDASFLPGGEKHYTLSVYYEKLQHLAKVVQNMGTDIHPQGPVLLGVAEVENSAVLRDLVSHSLLKERNYQFVHFDSRDARGVDVALLYNPVYFKLESAIPLYVSLPAESKDRRFTRDILYVRGLLLNERVHIFVNHWPSRVGGEVKSAPARAAAAETLKKQMAYIYAGDSLAKLIVMGDFNDDPVSPSLTKVLGARAEKHKTGKQELFNPWVEKYKNGNGTLAYRDAWGLFDQILVNGNWLNREQTGTFYYQSYIFRPSYLVETIGPFRGYPKRPYSGNTYIGGYSDHFPVYMVLMKRKED